MDHYENNPSGNVDGQEQSASGGVWYAPQPEELPAAESAAVEPILIHEPEFEIDIPEDVSWAPAPEEAAEPAAEPAAETPSAPVKPRRGKAWKGIVAAVLAVALVAGSSAVTAFVLNTRFDARIDGFQDQIAQLEQRLEAEESKAGISINTITASPSDGDTDPVILDSSTMTPAQVYAKNLSSVVMIYNEIPSSFGSYGGTSTGSGFILSADGYVVTNYHVVEGGGTLSVVTSDGTQYPATLTGYDNANDVAVLKIEAEGLQPVVIGDSDALVVGDQVAAIGNPLGELTSTLTVGYVSAKERDVNTSGFAINMIQTDAAINSGNSGGPLFNMRGEVVGITTAKYSGSSTSGASIEGIGFAIPINDVMNLLEDLVTNGRVTTPYLGISVSDMDPDGAAYYGLPVGAYVSEVVAGSCAETAGVQAEDIIVKLGGYDVTSVNSLSQALRNFDAGDTIELVVYRVDKEVTLSITLDERPEDFENTVTEQTQQPDSEESQDGDRFDSLIPGNG